MYAWTMNLINNNTKCINHSITLYKERSVSEKILRSTKCQHIETKIDDTEVAIT